MFVAVIGAGRIGSHIVKYLCARGDRVAVIEKDARKCDELSTMVEAMIFDGDGSNPTTYRSVEMTLVDILFAVTDNDEVNMAVCKMGNTKWGIPHVVARANDPKLKEEFSRVGADITICPMEEAYLSFENAIERLQVTNIFTKADSNFKIMSVKIPPNGVAVGKTITSLRIPRELLRDPPISKRCRIPVIIRRNDVLCQDENAVFEAEDQVFVMGLISEVEAVVNLLRRVE